MNYIESFLDERLISFDSKCVCSASEALHHLREVLSAEGFTLSIIENAATDHRLLSEEGKTLSQQATIMYAMLSVMCLICAGLACGLTQGLLSINPLELKVKLETGTESERAAAKNILPIVTKHHILLVTLMLFNASANEALPIFLDALVPSWLSIILAVTLVLICGEIIPSALFTGPNQLQIASFLTPITRLLILIFSPIAIPFAKVLDLWLGHDEGITVFNRREMAALVGIIHHEGRHEDDATRRDTLMHNDQVSILQGALNYIDKKVEDVMSRVEDMFLLPIECDLNAETISAIFQSGYSRVPVYEGTKDEIVVILLVKDLIFIDPDDEIPLKKFVNVFGREVLKVWEDNKLGTVLAQFQKKHSHMAIVHRVDSSGDRDPVYVTVGLITLEDIVEEILGAEIEDEHDAVSTPNESVFNSHFARDTDHIRLKILGSSKISNINANRHVSSLEAKEIVKGLLEKTPGFCDSLLSYAPEEQDMQKKEDYLQWKIENSPVFGLSIDELID